MYCMWKLIAQTNHDLRWLAYQKFEYSNAGGKNKNYYHFAEILKITKKF